MTEDTWRGVFIGTTLALVIAVAAVDCPARSETDLSAVCDEVRSELHKAHAAFLALPADEQRARRTDHVRMLGEGLLALKSCPTKEEKQWP